MTRAELDVLVKKLRLIFDVVRLVDVNKTIQFSVLENGEIKEENTPCYAFWDRNHRCDNCISAQACAAKSQMTKFEFSGTDIYHVISKYVEVEGVPYMLEMVAEISDKTLFGAYGKEDFIQMLKGYTTKLYVDPLTNSYNRRYYEEQISALKQANGVAMLDVDNFKEINDTYGHREGDMVLRIIAKTIVRVLRREDIVIRYGGDEFLLVFADIDEKAFPLVLERVRKQVEKIVDQNHPELKISCSIGGEFSLQYHADKIEVADGMLYRAKIKKNAVEYIIRPETAIQ